MTSPSSSAQQARQALGLRLREIRLDARLSARELAELMGRHPSKISRIEYGKGALSADDVIAWCRHCGASDQVPDLVASLRAVEGLWVEWRRMERSGLKQAQESRLPLWDRTRRFRFYSSFLIPGPIQTPAYIRAVLSSIRDRRGLINDVEEATAVRIEKQRAIHEGDHRFAVILEESVLGQVIGGTEVMAGQLGHLLSVASVPSVSLGIIPAGMDRTALWPVEMFFMFDDEQVSIELVSGFLTITQPREVAMYSAVFEELAGMAVYGAPARAMIVSAIDALDAQFRARPLRGGDADL